MYAVRVSESHLQRFREACNAEGRAPSDVFRMLMADFVRAAGGATLPSDLKAPPAHGRDLGHRFVVVDDVFEPEGPEGPALGQALVARDEVRCVRPLPGRGGAVHVVEFTDGTKITTGMSFAALRERLGL